MSPASLAAFFTAAKPGMRGPLTGSMMQSESRALPVALAHPWRMPATCAFHSHSFSVAVIRHTKANLHHTRALFFCLVLSDLTASGGLRSEQ